jgi:hypothetical protein
MLLFIDNIFNTKKTLIYRRIGVGKNNTSMELVEMIPNQIQI